jgi:hypothetical protein
MYKGGPTTCNPIQCKAKSSRSSAQLNEIDEPIDPISDRTQLCSTKYPARMKCVDDPRMGSARKTTASRGLLAHAGAAEPRKRHSQRVEIFEPRYTFRNQAF